MSNPEREKYFEFFLFILLHLHQPHLICCFTFFWRPSSEIPKFAPTSFMWDTRAVVCWVTPLLSIKQTCQIKRRYVCVGEPKPMRACRSYASLFLFVFLAVMWIDFWFRDPTEMSVLPTYKALLCRLLIQRRWETVNKHNIKEWKRGLEIRSPERQQDQEIKVN